MIRNIYGYRARRIMYNSDLDRHTLEALGGSLDYIDDIEISSRSIDKSDSKGNCVSIQDMDAHMKLKKKSLKTILDKLLNIIETKGVRSNEFFTFVRPFIMKTIHRYVPYDLVTDDLVHDCFIKTIIAFEGGYQYKGKARKRIWKEKYFDSSKCKNVGNFIFTICRNEASRFLEKQIQVDQCDDIDKELFRLDEGHKDASKNFITKNTTDLIDFNFKFKRILFNDEFNKHLNNIIVHEPINNLLYNLYLWGGSDDNY